MSLKKCPECSGKLSSQAASCPHCGHPNQPSANSQRDDQPAPPEAERGAKARPSRAGCYSVIAVLGFIMCVGVLSNENASAPKGGPSSAYHGNRTVAASASGTSYQSEDVVPYHIVKSENGTHRAFSAGTSLSQYSLAELRRLPWDKKMIYSVVLTPTIRRSQVRPTVERIITDLTERNPDLDEIGLRLYTSKDAFDNGPYDIGMAVWAPNGQMGGVTPEIARSNDRTTYKISVRVREDLDQYVHMRSQHSKKFGLTEEERKKIFEAEVAAEERAYEEADARIPATDGPSNDRNVKLSQELMAKYERGVRRKYGISEKVFSAISSEGEEKNWPMHWGKSAK